MGRHGTDPALRLRRAAGHLRGSATFLETIAAEEGIEMPLEVIHAVVVIRQWARSLGAVEPGSPVIPPGPRSWPEQVGARPRRRDGWRLRAP